MRFDPIAEGVETALQRRALLDLGCSFGQGYLFSRPLPAEGVEALLDQEVRAPTERLRAI